jgi:hypothetical protein
MVHFRLFAGAAVILATAALLPAFATAQEPMNNLGTSMSLTPATGDEAFGCETRWQYEFGFPPVSRQPTGMTSCTAYSPGFLSTTESHLIPVPGYVTKVRVRSGANPAPLRVTIMKRLFQTHPVTGQETDSVCCTGTGSESATFQPPPNTVHELTLNPPIKVTATSSQNGASGHRDIVAVSAVGPGDLPIASTGSHGVADYGPTMSIFYPKVETGLQGKAEHVYNNYVVLMNYDWVATIPCPQSSSAKASQTCPTPKTPKEPKTPISFKTKAKSLKLKQGKVVFKLACTAAKGTSCKGKATLRTRAKKSKKLAAKSFAIPGGKTKAITFKLSKKARKSVKKKGTKVSLSVDLGAAGKATKNLTLKR